MNLTQKFNDLKRRATKLSKSNQSAKVIFSFIVGVIMFIPAYILWFLWWLISPVGFWQIFAIVAGWVAVFGAFQFGLLVFGTILIVAVIFDAL